MNTRKYFWADLIGIAHLSKSEQAEALGCSRTTVAGLRREYIAEMLRQGFTSARFDE